MAKLKLKLDDLGNLEMDGSVEELATFVKTLRVQPLTETKSISTEEIKISADEEKEKKRIESILEKGIEEGIKIAEIAELTPLPAVNDVISYIVSKPHFEHHTKELQEKFLGKGIKYRDNHSLYGRFDMLIRNAKKKIEKQHNGVWEVYKIIPLQGKTHVKVYRFKPKVETVSASFEPFFPKSVVGLEIPSQT